ncbi:MAG: GntR family transcriptional regulator [Lentisphaeria bacterium]|nr:GntR family transcriptional regulator [Lentisphaeria bacterium]
MKRLNHQQLALKIIRRIKNGEYSGNGKIESIRELAQKYGVGRQVATTALKYLAKHDYIYFVHGSGTYVNQSKSSGLYHRIAYFYSKRNLAVSAISMMHLLNIAIKNGFELIPGSNFEEDYSFREWLEKRDDFDGVIMNGDLDERDLNYLKRHRIPYVVHGNHAISPDHPQSTVDITAGMCEEFKKLFEQHPWKKVALLCGSTDSRSYREAVEGFVIALKSSGMDYSPERILTTDTDGVKELTEYLAKEVPDAIVLLCDYWKGFQKYCRLHPEFKRPEVVIPEIELHRAPDGVFDWNLSHDDCKLAEQLAEKTMSVLLEQIYKKHGR